MASQRHNPDSESVADDGPVSVLDAATDADTDTDTDTDFGPRDGYLDAARAAILDHGWSRTTMTEVARRAGVSRMTLYRTWNDMPSMLADLMTREVRRLRTSAQKPDVEPVTPEDIADQVLAAVRAIRANDLFARIIELDPQILLPYLFNRRGRSQELILDHLTALIATGRAQAPTAQASPTAQARAIILAAHGFALSAQTMIDDQVSVDDLDDLLHQAVLAIVTEGSR